MQPIGISIADDHVLFSQTLGIALTTQEHIPLQLIDTAYSGNQILKCIEERVPDVLLLDLNMPDGDGFKVLSSVKKHFKSIRVIAITMYDDPKFIKQVLQNGGMAYLLKTCPFREVLHAIHMVMDDKTYIAEGLKIFPKNSDLNGEDVFEDEFQQKYNLTKREVEILLMISDAKSNKEIADELFISDQTVSVHRKNIMRKLNVSNTAGLIKFAMDHILV